MRRFTSCRSKENLNVFYSNKKLNMVKLQVIPSRPKHNLFYISSIKELIISYCQYSDAKKIYKLIRCKEPEKTLLFLSECLDESYEEVADYMECLRFFIASKYSIDKIISKIGSIDTVFIPYESKIYTDTKILSDLVKKDINIMWQCPQCGIYTKIKHRGGDIYVRKVQYENRVYAVGYKTFYCICDCLDRSGDTNKKVKINSKQVFCVRDALEHHYT